MNRRDFLSTSMLFGALGLTGCCTRAPSIELEKLNRVNSNPLKPFKVNSGLRLTSKVIDAHSHIFNASDLQVGGYLRGPIAYSFQEPLRTILQLLAEPVEWFAKHASLSAYSEMKVLSSVTFSSETDSRSKLKQLASAHKEWAAMKLMSLINGTEVEGRINSYLFSHARDFGKQIVKLNEKYLLDAFEYGAAIEPTARGADLLKGMFAFIGFILSPRYSNLMDYQKGYAESDNSFGVDGCYSALVDFDYWIGNCDHTVSRLRDQILLTKRISDLSDGYMKPLVAYNPWTDIEDGDESISLVIDAIKNHNFKGVKIYPPMGFFPSNNANNPNLPTDAKFPDLQKLDEKLSYFFAKCRELDIPVMAHSNESMGRKPSHDELGGPQGWRSFFNDGGNAGTKINLAHIGGESGGGSAANWTKQFAEIMAQDSASNLYGDLGFWDGAVARDQEAIKRLVELLHIPVSNNQIVADRIMFGTDWFMLARTGNWSEYAFEFQEALVNANVSQNILDKIFFKNAERFFE